MSGQSGFKSKSKSRRFVRKRAIFEVPGRGVEDDAVTGLKVPSGGTLKLRVFDTWGFDMLNDICEEITWSVEFGSFWLRQCKYSELYKYSVKDVDGAVAFGGCASDGLVKAAPTHFQSSLSLV